MSFFWRYIFLYVFFYHLFLFFGDVFEAFLILSAILFPIKSPIASAVFCMTLFQSFKCICGRLFSMIKKFPATIFTIQVFNYILSNILTHVFSKIQKPITFLQYVLVEMNSLLFFRFYTLKSKHLLVP